jgi:hypothetical protein
LENPPRSSYPPSIAYHAAKLQDVDRADRLLRRLREAFAAERRRIDREDVLATLAGEVGLEVARFREDLESQRAREAFETDLERTRRNQAGVLPSFAVGDNQEGPLLRGFQAFEAIADALDDHDPPHFGDARPARSKRSSPPGVATREAEEVYDLSTDEALDRLRRLENDGDVRSVERGTGRLWETT